MTKDERAIRELIAAWLAANQAGDLDKVLSLMSDDAIFMVPGQKPFGKQAFAAAFAQQRDVHMAGTSDIQEVRVVGDWAYLRNYLSLTITPQGGGKTLRRSGYTLTILIRQPAGNWVLVRDANLMTAEA